MTAAVFPLLIVLSIATAGPSRQDAGALAGWRDGEVRASYNASTNQTEVMVALRPNCPAGTPSLVFTVVFKGREATSPPAFIQVRAAATVNVSPAVMRTLTLRFVLEEPGRKHELDLTDRLRNAHGPVGAGGRIDAAYGEFRLPEFMRLLEARSVVAEPLGLGSCSLTPEQLDALREFARKTQIPLKASSPGRGPRH